ncbi:MAG TPA: hypothetical protein VFL14_06255 [Xanthomonadales bacterium]|nr:hypothetical protein [Xanthomonadales bacterium]
MLLCTLLAAGGAAAQSSGGIYTLRKSVIGAGATTQGTPYRLVATAAQPSAAVATGGNYRLTGGFHQRAGPGALFCNGFEDTACTTGAP